MRKATSSLPTVATIAFKFSTRTEHSWGPSVDGGRGTQSSRAWRESRSTRRETFWWQIEKTTGFKCFKVAKKRLWEIKYVSSAFWVLILKLTLFSCPSYRVISFLASWGLPRVPWLRVISWAWQMGDDFCCRRMGGMKTFDLELWKFRIMDTARWMYG